MVIKRQICVGLGTHFTLVSGEGIGGKRIFFYSLVSATCVQFEFPPERQAGWASPGGRQSLSRSLHLKTEALI